MKGDFSRNTFDPHKHFTRVLMQQGRVQLDADWNEQTAILLYYLRALAADLIGPHGGPASDWGFEIMPNGKSDFEIGPGRYYVNGILCENEVVLNEDGSPLLLLYTSQPGYPFLDAPALEDDGTYLVYLDVWERHITYIQDESICEVALGGPDTATRAKVVWQVKVVPVELGEGEGSIEERIKALEQELEELKVKRDTAEAPGEEGTVEKLTARMNEIESQIAWLSRTGETVASCDMLLRKKLADLGKLAKPYLRARAYVETPSEDPCITPPEARYRGAENQLYRVEIHRSGSAWDGEENTKATAATFKWSHDNGSIVFPLHSPASFTTSLSGTKTGIVTDTMTVTVEHLGRDGRFGLAVRDCVELVDDDYVLQGADEALWQVDAIDPISMQVTLKRNRASNSPTSDVGRDLSKHPLLRRWDHKEGDPKVGGLQLHDGAALIREGKGDKNWLILEDGVHIQFQKPDKGQLENKNKYRTGDYWLIPARTAIRDVEWPGPQDAPEAVPPHGVEHHYAPLAIIPVKDGIVKGVGDCRCQFSHLRECP